MKRLAAAKESQYYAQTHSVRLESGRCVLLGVSYVS